MQYNTYLVFIFIGLTKLCIIRYSDFSLFTVLSVSKYIFAQPLRHGENITQGIFLIGIHRIWNHCIPSPTLVAVTRLQSPVYLIFWLTAQRRDRYKKRTANRLVQDLNSGRQVHLLQLQLLCNMCVCECVHVCVNVCMVVCIHVYVRVCA